MDKRLWRSIQWGQLALEYGMLLVGLTIMACAYPLFFIPHQIAPGGVTGIATLLNHLADFPIGITTLVLNIPLFLVGLHSMGKTFVFRSLIAMTGSSLLMDFIPTQAVSKDPLLSALAGGVLLGVGLGLVLRAGATTGGSDMAAKLVHTRFPILSIGGLLLAIDFIVIAAAGFTFDFQAALYAAVALFISTKVMDQVVEGFNTAKAYFIISEHITEIAEQVMSEIERGATILHASGAYSKRERNVLFCVVTRMQIMQLKRIVREIDPRAFVVATDVHEAMGEGFQCMR